MNNVYSFSLLPAFRYHRLFVSQRLLDDHFVSSIRFFSAPGLLLRCGGTVKSALWVLKFLAKFLALFVFSSHVAPMFGFLLHRQTRSSSKAFSVMTSSNEKYIRPDYFHTKIVYLLVHMNCMPYPCCQAVLRVQKASFTQTKHWRQTNFGSESF